MLLGTPDGYEAILQLKSPIVMVTQPTIRRCCRGTNYETHQPLTTRRTDTIANRGVNWSPKNRPPNISESALDLGRIFPSTNLGQAVSYNIFHAFSDLMRLWRDLSERYCYVRFYLHISDRGHLAGR